MSVLTMPVTVDNFDEVASLPEFADCLVEIIEGEIVTMSLHNPGHGEIVMELGSEIRNYVKQNRLGRVTGGDAAFIMERNEHGRDTIRGLDIAYLSYAKAPEPLPYRVVDLVPDLAIEVMSPGNSFVDIRNKVRQLLDIGCPQVWIVVPGDREVDVHSAAGISTYGEGDTISAGDALPGFEIEVADIFPS